MTDDTAPSNGATDSSRTEREDDSQEAETVGEACGPTREELAAENEQLRERVADLEAALADVQESLAKQPGDTSGDSAEAPGGPVDTPAEATAEGTPELVTSGGQPTKVIGRLSDDQGIGVLGEATASSTETYGVHGLTQSSDNGAAGVSGKATASSGEVYGVYAESDSRDSEVGSLFAAAGGNSTAIEADGRILTNNNLNLDKDNSNTFRRLYMARNANFFYNPDFDGNSYIGATNADYFATTSTDLFVENARLRFDDATEQRTAGPIAKGYVSADASTTVNTVNAPTVEWDSTNSWYEIEIEGVDYIDTDYATMVTPRRDAVAFETGFISDPDRLTLEFADSSQHDFSFVVHELPDGQVTSPTNVTNAETTDSSAPSSSSE